MGNGLPGYLSSQAEEVTGHTPHCLEKGEVKIVFHGHGAGPGGSETCCVNHSGRLVSHSFTCRAQWKMFAVCSVDGELVTED